MAVPNFDRIQEMKEQRRKEFDRNLDMYLRKFKENPERHYPIHTDRFIPSQQRGTSNNQELLFSQSTGRTTSIQELEAERARLEQLKKELEEKECRLKAYEETLVQKENKLNNKPKTKSLFRRIFKR